MVRNFLNAIKEGKFSSDQKLKMMRTVNEKTLPRLMNSRYILSISMLSFGFVFFTFAKSHDRMKYQVSVTRRVSQFTGFLATMPLPPYLRVYLYKAFGGVYGINFDEIKMKDLNEFRTWNQFFTRELAEDARVIAEPADDKTLVSPCDGKIMSIGEVDTLATTMDCIKGNTYRLDEFLFGYIQKAQGEKRATMERMIDSARIRDNKVMYMVLYLSPKDYHRFHSPASFTASYRRHIAGYLEPVDPRYVKGHKDVYKSNERVNVLGDWAHGFLAISFVGAMNVGSIKLHFDENLRTNDRKQKSVQFQDKNYAALSEIDGTFWKYPQRHRNIDGDECD